MALEDKYSLIDAWNALDIQEKEAAEQQDFENFCNYLDAVPLDLTKSLEGNLVAGVDLNPMTWMEYGVRLIDSFESSAFVQLGGGQQGKPMNKTLHYPVFQMGCEQFLKGMWLAKKLTDEDVKFGAYTDVSIRNKINKTLKNEIGGHNLLTLLDTVHQIDEYKEDGSINTFLVRLNALIRDFYFPLYEPCDRSFSWAYSRYPVAFYDSAQKKRETLGFCELPPQTVIKKLFKPIPDKIDKLWKITEYLIKDSK